MFVVAGVSGRTGAVVAHRLLARHQPVRVLVRSEALGTEWRRRGAEAVVADLAEATSVASALRGAQGAFLLVPPTAPSATGVLESRRRLIDAMAQGVEQSGIPHVVVLSSIGAHLREGTGVLQSLHYAEQRFLRLDTSLTFLRAGLLLENWLSSVRQVLESSQLVTYLSPEGRRMDMVAAWDVGVAAARLVMDPTSTRRTIELTGPEEYSAVEIARVFSQLVHKPVHTVALPAELQCPALMESGYSAELAALHQQVTDAINRGHLRWESPPQHRVKGSVTALEALKGLLVQSPMPVLGRGLGGEQAAAPL